MVTRKDYSAAATRVARSVLIELMHLLGEYRDDIVLVGGWVPEFLCPHPLEPHVGSTDVDLALDHRHLTEAGYKTILSLLLAHGYQQGDQPFIFFRAVTAGDRSFRVEVDLLGGEYEGTGKSHRTQKVQDIRVRKARGADLAFDHPVVATVEGELPGGGRDTVTVRVAAAVPFLTMKAMTLDARLKEKDAWDIYYCTVNYPGGVGRLVEEFRPYLANRLVKEGLMKMGKHFASVDSLGPAHVVDFQEVTDTEERQRIRRDAFERVHYLLDQLGVEGA